AGDDRPPGDGSPVFAQSPGYGMQEEKSDETVKDELGLHFLLRSPSGEAHAEQRADQVGDRPRAAAYREHAQAVAHRAAAREDADHRADPEQGDGGKGDRRDESALAASESKRRERHERAGGERKKRGQRRAPGRAEVLGIEAEFFARQRVEGQ